MTGLTVSQVAEICTQRPYAEMRWWSLWHDTIIEPGVPAMGTFSYRGFLIKKTADYDIYKPFVFYTKPDDHVASVTPLSRGPTLVAYQIRDLSAWFEFLWTEIAAGYQRLPESIDGIPWQIHSIEDRDARLFAIDAYLDNAH